MNAKGVTAATVSTWAADAETTLLPSIIHWPERARAMEKAGCSKSPHSFS